MNNKTLTQYQQTKIDNINNNFKNPIVSTSENHAHFVIDPRNVGKNFYMLKYFRK